MVATSKVHGAFKGTADFDCLQYLIAKWYANILGWEILCVVMSCNIKVDTQKVRVYIYMEFESAFLCFFMECAHCQKENNNKKTQTTSR